MKETTDTCLPVIWCVWQDKVCGLIQQAASRKALLCSAAVYWPPVHWRVECVQPRQRSHLVLSSRHELGSDGSQGLCLSLHLQLLRLGIVLVGLGCCCLRLVLSAHLPARPLSDLWHTKLERRWSLCLLRLQWIQRRCLLVLVLVMVLVSFGTCACMWAEAFWVSSWAATDSRSCATACSWASLLKCCACCSICWGSMPSTEPASSREG